jgi:CRP-like cAMP-binding protein
MVQMLQKTPLWASLSENELKVIAEESRELKFDNGHVIVEKGATGVGFFLMLEGMAEVRSEGRVLSRLGPGQFFGEMSLLDDRPRTADVVAVEPSRCLGLTAWAFACLLAGV